MNGYELEADVLRKNLEFIREEIKRMEVVRSELEASKGVRSDDADTLLRGYGRIMSELKYLLRFDYDAEHQ